LSIRASVDTVAEFFAILTWLGRRVADRSFGEVGLGKLPASISFYSTTDWERFVSDSPIRVSAMDKLVLTEKVADFECSIHDVAALACSKDPLEKSVDLDDFAERHCIGLIEKLTVEQLEKCLGHCDARIMKKDGNFRQYVWDERLILMNGDGSHNFAAARYIAKRLSIDVPLKAMMYRFRINPEAVRQMRAAYDVFALADDDCHWMSEQLRTFDVPVEILMAPPPYNNEGERLFFLPKSSPRAMSVSRMLSQAGLLDVGNLLYRASKLDGSIPVKGASGEH